jgi:hypothetical protein
VSIQTIRGALLPFADAADTPRTDAPTTLAATIAETATRAVSERPRHSLALIGDFMVFVALLPSFDPISGARSLS